jgi:hypothetical protein
VYFLLLYCLDLHCLFFFVVLLGVGVGGCVFECVFECVVFVLVGLVWVGPVELCGLVRCCCASANVVVDLVNPHCLQTSLLLSLLALSLGPIDLHPPVVQLGTYSGGCFGVHVGGSIHVTTPTSGLVLVDHQVADP